MTLSCIIIEDEPLAAEKLEGFIKRSPYLELKASFRKSPEGLRYIKENPVDLVFLDIQMDEMTGIELLESLTQKPLVILTTAYQEYALRGYELHVSDYLLKPYDFTRFLKAVDKVYEEFTLRTQSPSEPGNSIFVKTEYRIEKVLLDTILYIEGMSDYLRLHLNEGKPIMCLQKFAAFEATLPASRFVRVHKSYLVALDKIDSIERAIIRIGEATIPIGRTYQERFFALLGKQGLV
ncbi:MAG TPA: DNA-binding response regulator [Cytophagales bacterium]|nr:DNA-binding response regulator [Cytophagales bacterium]HAA18913.1 DNA-binding response regulator [Cytophagales bacterium]HAP62563.1 DNA-binding response regulator [Cytophagales bacterium]